MFAWLIPLVAVPCANAELSLTGRRVAEQATAEHSAATPQVGLPAVANSPSSAASIGDPPGIAVIYIARRGWHIDIGFNAADLQSPLASLVPEFPGVRYLFFGFGDEHYLLAKHRNAPVLLAALWPGRGMILATGLKSSPDDAFGAVHVITLTVTRTELQAAEDFVQRSFGAIRPYASGPYDGSLYFTAKQKYSALHTCNTWVAEVLKAGGLRVHTAGVVFAGQLWTQARRLEREQSARRASLLSRQAIARSACSQLQGGLVPS